MRLQIVSLYNNQNAEKRQGLYFLVFLVKKVVNNKNVVYLQTIL
jgi:hypothetical protein